VTAFDLVVNEIASQRWFRRFAALGQLLSDIGMDSHTGLQLALPDEMAQVHSAERLSSLPAVGSVHSNLDVVGLTRW
jgi:hypothetical protein